MALYRFFLPDFIEIQRKSFFELLKTGLIEEFSKRNPITNVKKDFELFFYPEYYKLTIPEYSPVEAILYSKSYTSKLYLPAQLTYISETEKTITLKWVYIGNLPIMTKRGHFILNGAPRVIVNQILRSPGIYYKEIIHETVTQISTPTKKPKLNYKRYYADLICLRGTWLRLEIDKEKKIWAKTKKGPKIPVFWFLIGMGLTERVIFKSLLDPTRILCNLENFLAASGSASPDEKKSEKQKKKYIYLQNPMEAWKEIYSLISVASVNLKNKSTNISGSASRAEQPSFGAERKKQLVSGSETARFYSPSPKEMGSQPKEAQKENQKPQNYYSQTIDSKSSFDTAGQSTELSSQVEFNIARATSGVAIPKKENIVREDLSRKKIESADYELAELGRKWMFNKFMNPRSYDLGKQGRLAFNKKLGLNISTNKTTLTGQDLLNATDYLIKIEKGLKNTDDIDHLKNRRVRTSAELIQIQVGIGILRLEKIVRETLNKKSSEKLMEKAFKMRRSAKQASSLKTNQNSSISNSSPSPNLLRRQNLKVINPRSGFGNLAEQEIKTESTYTTESLHKPELTFSNLINSKAFNSAIREFFGTSPLSQFMDQINPLAEITHKRRLSSMGPGGVTRDTAMLDIRGIHPTHYGRICPIETPEGKNTGLVNSMTTYARVNSEGILESPFYKVYKGQVQKNTGIIFLSAEEEEKIKLAAADLFVSSIGFLPKSKIPVRIGEDFTKISRTQVQYVGIAPIQMISIATSLIPFLEHDDANRALMGSNMQRQAVPLIRPERPIVGTGLEGRAVSDSGHVVQTKFSGLVTYVSAEKIIVSNNLRCI